MVTIRNDYSVEVIGENRGATVYISASGDFCCILSEYSKEDLVFNLNTQSACEAVHIVRELIQYGY